MLDSYRRVLGIPGTLPFTLAGLAARLPISMVSLGIVLLVQEVTGSYGLAGTYAATFVLAQAALALFHGRLLDRVGQGRVLATATTVSSAALALMLVAVLEDWPVALAYAGAAVAGATLPQVGSAVRARWAHVLTGRARDLQTAYAFEGVVDEAVFIIGPILVTVLATTFHPATGLTVALLVGLVGTWAFSLQRGTEPPVLARRDATTGAGVAMPWGVVVPLTVVSLALGTLFGAAEVITLAFATEHDAKQWTGGLLALWSLGSLVAGILTGVVHWRIGVEVRVRRGAIGMALAMVPLALIDEVWLMGAVLLLGGLAISPTLISTMSLVEQVVPRARLTEAMGVLHTGLLAGVAPGAALSGALVDRFGTGAAYAVPIGAGVLAAVVAQTLRGPRFAPSAGPDLLDA